MSPTTLTFIALAGMATLFAGLLAEHIITVRRFNREHQP